MLSRMGSLLRCTLATAVGGSRPHICSITSLREFVPGSAHQSWTGHSLPPARSQILPQQLSQRVYSSYPAWDEELEEGEHFVEYVPEPFQPSTLPVPSDEQQLLQVGVVGAPNAGKSTLTNALVGTKARQPSAQPNDNQAIQYTLCCTALLHTIASNLCHSAGSGRFQQYRPKPTLLMCRCWALGQKVPDRLCSLTRQVLSVPSEHSPNQSA